jgi:hypothetical protein
MADTQVKAVRELTDEEKAMVAALSPEQGEKLKKILQSKLGGAKRLDEAEVLAKSKLIIKDGAPNGKTVDWDPENKKQYAMIRCSIPGCKELRKVFTSDLHQVKVCITHRKDQKKVARQARTEERDMLLELGRKALEAQKASE